MPMYYKLRDKTLPFYFSAKYRKWTEKANPVPMWVELKIDFTEKYLQKLKDGLS